MTANGHTAKEPFSQETKKNKPAQLVTPTTVIVDDVERTEIPAGFLVSNKTTGAIHYESVDGDRKEVRAAKPAPAPPEKPKPIPGKLVVGDDGVHRFIPDEDGPDGPGAIDLSASMREREEEKKLSDFQRALRDAEKRHLEAMKKIEAMAADEDKIRGLVVRLEQVQNENAMLNGIAARYEAAILGQSILLAKAQR